jgi:hypothetical protein
MRETGLINLDALYRRRFQGFEKLIANITLHAISRRVVSGDYHFIVSSVQGELPCELRNRNHDSRFRRVSASISFSGIKHSGKH